eukprot:GHVN01068436.1.p1 GENE.GHVN01068436.1~~GHVN01068436.1.p1  ORF type:complete len:235 (+),score=25.21 GHVN01068436.1:1076-1780(+)
MEGTPLPVESQHPERRPHPSKAASPLNATNFIAGGLAGTTVDLVLYPLDAIKTRLQAVKQLNSTRTSGVRLHYAGLGAAMAASFPAASIFFGFYEGTKLYIMRNKAEGGWAQSVPDWSVPGIAVCMAEGVTSCFRVPFEVVKQQMQLGMHKTPVSAARSIYLSGGALAFTAGLGATIAREIPFDGIEFTLWEELKRIGADGTVSEFQACFCKRFRDVTKNPGRAVPLPRVTVEM